VKVAGVLAVVAAIAVGIALAGTGSGDSGDSEVGAPAYGVGQIRGGSVAQLARCTDWNGGTDAQKQVTLDDIQSQLNQPGADGPTPDLPDDEAIALLDRICGRSYAAGFRLYKVYARGAAFAPLAAG
jgi:hypothetical protein